MTLLETLITALTAGAAAALQSTASQAITDSYHALKSIIQRKFSNVDVTVLEKDPTSKSRKIVLEEELDKAKVADDPEVLQRAQKLLDSLVSEKSGAAIAQVIGVDLENIKAASFKLSDIIAQGSGSVTGVKVKGAIVEGAFEISGVRAVESIKESSVVGVYLENSKTGRLDGISTPTHLRLDTAVPEYVMPHRSFEVAVSLRQPNSPKLEENELTKKQSGDLQVVWPENAQRIRLRLEVRAPECEIIGNHSYLVLLYKGSDSPVYYFSLKPKLIGLIGIVVIVYQEEDQLGATRANVVVRDQQVGKVNIQIVSQPLISRFVDTSQHFYVSSTRRIKILFLAANPSDTARLRMDEEMRAIDQALRLTECRNFDISSHWAVRIEDLQQLLLRHQPDIVHFSGHGEVGEIMLQDAAGKSVPVRATALRQLFQVLKDNIRCVVLNACSSEAQAAAIAEVIDVVVGMSDKISDDASRQFSASFYGGLGYGRTVAEAFQLGCNQIDLGDLGEAGVPVLMPGKINPATIRFADPKA